MKNPAQYVVAFCLAVLLCVLSTSDQRATAVDLGTFETAAPTTATLRDLSPVSIVPTTPPQDELASAPSGIVCENGVCRIVQRPVPDAISTRSSTYYRATVCSGRFRYLGRAVVGNTFCVGRCVLSRIFRR